MSRTHGVSIFIDYCTAAAIQRKVEEKERDTGLINGTRSTAVHLGLLGDSWPALGEERLSEPPPTPPQQDYSQILATSPKVEDGLHLGACEYGS